MAFVIVQPEGTVLTPLEIDEFQVASGFFTKRPLDATPSNQPDVYELPGVVVNIAFM